MKSQITNHKLVTYYVANTGNSTVFNKLSAYVRLCYPEEANEIQQAITYALYHSCRNCHRQGYVRDHIADYAKGRITKDMLVHEVRRLVGYYNKSTIYCWLPVIEDNQGQVMWRAKPHYEAYRAKKRPTKARAKQWREQGKRNKEFRALVAEHGSKKASEIWLLAKAQ